MHIFHMANTGNVRIISDWGNKLKGNQSQIAMPLIGEAAEAELDKVRFSCLLQ